MSNNDALYAERVPFPNSTGPRPVLNNIQFEALVELVEQGPISRAQDNCVIYEQLIKYGFASTAVVKGVIGYYVATNQGAFRYAMELGEGTVAGALLRRKDMIQNQE